MNYKREVRKVRIYTLTHICNSSQVRYRKVWLLNAYTYIFRRNILLNLPYLLSACAYREYC